MESSEMEITLRLRVPGTLKIKREGGKFYTIHYRGESNVYESRHVGSLCHEKLVRALPFFFGRAVINTQKMGALAVKDGGETKRLRQWLRPQQ